MKKREKRERHLIAREIANVPATAWLPPSSGPTRQYPSRKKPVMGDWENRERGFLNTKYAYVKNELLFIYLFL